MFISKFNRLIRNKYVWTGFAIIVIISFVAWQTTTPGASGGEELPAGQLDGKPVKQSEFREAYFHSLLSLSLMSGRPVQVTPRIDKVLRDMAWRRLITLRTAREAGLEATGDEVVAAIQQQPFFHENNTFSRERYAGFLQQFLAGMGVGETRFEEHIRQELVLSKARRMVSAAAWVAPAEIEDLFHQLYDLFSIRYVSLTFDEREHAAEVGDPAARAYFEANSNAFEIPAAMRVQYVEFPFDRFWDAAAVDDAAVRGYYDEHIEDFTTLGTGDLLAAQSFEEVASSIRSQLVQSAAETAAGDKAAEFEVSLAPDRQGAAPAFEDAARTAGLAVVESPVFQAGEPPPGQSAGMEFVRAAFALRNTPDEYFSPPVRGSNAYYVLAYVERQDARPAAFEEVREAVMAQARAQAVSNDVMRLGAAIRDAAAASLDGGKSFDQAVSGFGLEVHAPPPFAMRTGPEDPDEDESFFELLRAVLFLNPGELTGVVSTDRGILVGYLADRDAADRAVLASIRADMAGYIGNRRQELVFQEWQKALLEAHGFEGAAAGADLLADAEEGDADADNEFPPEDE